MFYSCHLLLDHIQFILIHGLNIPGSYAILFFTASYFNFITRHIYNWASFLLWPSCFILSGAISSCPPLFPRGAHLLFHIFLPFYTWSSHGWCTGVVCHSLFQWITFCQNSPLWPVHLRWPSTACLIASLGYASPFAMTGQWSMKGH